ncbi:MAG: glucose-6-phosphate dehydrogenase [Blastocatellia bacterium]
MNDQNQPLGRSSDPCVMVIFGATGDLTKRKLFPSLYNLAESNLLSREFAVICTARNEMTTEAYRDQITDDMKTFATGAVDPNLWDWFRQRIYYSSCDVTNPESYQRLKDTITQVDQSHGGHGNYFFYLAISPNFFGETVRQLGAAGLTKEENGQWRRVIIEKPFGKDLESACTLNADLKRVLSEKQIYRIDHYLGKETVQNILVFRFGNGLFEPIWNRNYIDHVEITASETVGVEMRGGYYETSGALRDMVPNHLFQLLSLTAMEPPVSFDANAVRDEQAKVLNAISPIPPEEVLTRAIRGQYGEGEKDDERLPGYRTEPQVASDSKTETFVALKLMVDNWRWADVPFYLRTGKRMPKRVTEISIQFKHAPLMLFRGTPVDRLRTNRLNIHIQPDEGISLRFGAKIPGPIMKLGAVEMDFNYIDYFGQVPSTGYERLLYDCMIGDATLFQRADMVEAGWSVIGPILDVWKALPPRAFPNYPAGTWGPREAEELLEHDGREWHKVE